MTNALHDDGLLGAIRKLTSERNSGRLQVFTGMTEGALFFNRGRLVDAQVGKLSGFQAINALISAADATYNFEPSVAPPAQSSITGNERVLLKDFFGIDAGDPEPLQDVELSWPPDHSTPERVVPLSDVDDDRSELVMIADGPQNPSEPPVEPLLNDRQQNWIHDDLVSEDEGEVTLIKRKRPFSLPDRPVRRSVFRPALFLGLLLLLVGAAAAALLYKFRRPETNVAVAPSTQPTTQPTTQPSAPVEAPQSSPAAVAQEADNGEVTSTSANLNGNWNVINTVEQTSYQPYKNMQVGFNVSINQTGNKFTGTGQKISENGQTLPATSRTPIVVKGTINGDKVEATFSESGAVRKTNGRFVWKLDRVKGGLTGTFVSTAARARGKSAATKAS